MCLKHNKYACFCQVPVLLAFISLEPVRLHFNLIWAAPWSPNGYFDDFGGAAIDLNSCLKQKLGKRLGKGKK